MQLVPSDDITQGADGDGGVVGCAGTQRGFWWEAAKEQRGGAADVLELRDQIAPGPVVEAARGDVRVLIESSQRLRIVARESHRPVGEDPFCIDEVPQSLLDAPLAGRVAVQRLRLWNRAQRGERLADLSVESSREVVALDQGEVFGVVGTVVGDLVPADRTFSLETCTSVPLAY